MAKRLGKTEKELLARLGRSPHGRIGVEWGHTAGRRNSGYGNREREAARALETKSLVSIVSDGDYRLYGRNGVCTHTYLWHVTLAPHVTPADLEILLASS